MHAVVARSTIDDREKALAFLKENVLPRISQAPGFIAGYWYALEGNAGASTLLFESEEAARAAMEKFAPPPGVNIVSREVAEVVADVKAAAHA